jgi:peptidoglycan/xylan/chitin deacetylase (PgdA/CDA1 family)
MLISRRAFLAGVTGISAGMVAACTKAARKPSGPPVTGGTTPTDPTGVQPTTIPLGPARFVRSGPPGSTGVALTFHGSGAVNLTDALLARAAALTAPITVFAVGNWLSANPGVASKVVGGGHELANHTWSHVDIIHLPQTGVRDEIIKCRDVIASQAGVPPDFFRPSQTDVPNDLILAEAGLAGYRTVTAFDGIVRSIRARGLRPVLVRDLLGPG